MFPWLSSARYFRYWTGSGWSSPNVLRYAVMIAAEFGTMAPCVCIFASIAPVGSPGARWTSTKLSVAVSQMTAKKRATRRMTYDKVRPIARAPEILTAEAPDGRGTITPKPSGAPDPSVPA